MKNIVVSAFFAFLLFSTGQAFAASSQPPILQKLMRVSANVAISEFDQTGIHGLATSQQRCYANPQNEGAAIGLCIYADISSALIAANIAYSSNAAIDPFFNADTLDARIKKYLPGIGITDNNAKGFVGQAIAYIDPIIVQKLRDRNLLTSQPSGASGLHLFDTDAYCREVGNQVGGSADIELSCRNMEMASKREIESNMPGTRIFDYCKSVATSVGGSYDIMESCIQQEQIAQKQLDGG